MDFATQWEDCHTCAEMRSVTDNRFCRRSTAVGVRIDLPAHFL